MTKHVVKIWFINPDRALPTLGGMFLGAQLQCWHGFDYWTLLKIKPSLTD
ncbi:hypothetical protein [Bacillus sp. UMB0893]|nr:hypothetical protein [Bacillus sp. UMB0893]